MLSERIKKLRIEKGISQAALANVLGITQQAVAKWECAKAEPDSSTLKKIANYFEVTTDYLLGNSNENSCKLNEQQTELVNEFDSLSVEGQKELLNHLNYLKYLEKKKFSSAEIPFPRGGNISITSNCIG